MEHPENYDIRACLAIQDQVIADRKGPNTWTEVVPSAPGAGVISQQVESLGDELNHPIGEIDVSAFLEEIERDVLEVCLGLRRETVGHQREAGGFSAVAIR